jgi:hypothetical protein
MYNNRWISKIASPPRLPSSLQGAKGFLTVVYFKDIFKWIRHLESKQTMKKKHKLKKKLGRKFYYLVLKE